MPDTTAFVVWYLIAGWELATGVFEIVAALRLRRVYDGELLLASAGCASIVLGLMMLMWPRAAMITLAWLVGIYAGVFGILLVALAARLRRVGHSEEARDPGRRQPLTILSTRR